MEPTNFMLSSPANGRTRVATGDYGRRINDPRNVYMAFTIAIIDLAKRHPDHGEPVPAMTYDSIELELNIEYHPRPDAVKPVSYILAVDGLKKMPRALWLARHFNECSFVVFDRNDPIVDGSLKFSSSDDKASQRLAGDSRVPHISKAWHLLETTASDSLQAEAVRFALDGCTDPSHSYTHHFHTHRHQQHH